MYWNAGSEIFKYKATELLATGDLTDETVIKALEKEILETAQYTDSNTGVKWWSKNLAERRLDVILIAQEGGGI